MAYGRRYSSRTSRGRASYSRTTSRRSGARRGSYSVRRKSSRRKSTVSRRSAGSARPQRVIIEVRQSPVQTNPIEGLLAAAKQVEKPKKAKF